MASKPLLPVQCQKGVIVVLYRRTGRVAGRGDAIEYLLFERILNWKGVEICKGGIDAGESAETAALREVSEEAGLSLAAVVPTESVVRYGFTANDDAGRKVRVEREFAVFTADITGLGAPRADGFEHRRVWFAPFDEAVEALTYSDMKNLLKDVHPLLQQSCSQI